MCLLRRCTRRLSHQMQALRQCRRWTRRLRYWMQIGRSMINWVSGYCLEHKVHIHDDSAQARTKEWEGGEKLHTHKAIFCPAWNEGRSKLPSCLQAYNVRTIPQELWRSSWTLTWHKRVPRYRENSRENASLIEIFSRYSMRLVPSERGCTLTVQSFCCFCPSCS